MRRTFIAMALILMSLAPCVRAQMSRSAPESKVRGWKTYRNMEFGFEFQYPKQPSLIDYAAGANQQEFSADQPVIIYFRARSGSLPARILSTFRLLR